LSGYGYGKGNPSGLCKINYLWNIKSLSCWNGF
jgi:hypothetical protein